MPFQTIKTREYECIRCGYKWIRRKNGIENRTKPRFCPGCKTWMWNMEYTNGGLTPERWYDSPEGERRWGHPERDPDLHPELVRGENRAMTRKEVEQMRDEELTSNAAEAAP